MSGWWTNAGKADVVATAIGSADLRLLLVTTAPVAATAAADLNFVADVVADECSGTGYARKALANEAVVEDDANDRARITADDPALYPLADFGTPVGAWVYRQVTTDADSILWTFLPISSPVVTNGGDFTVQFDSLGISTVTSTA